MNLKEAYSVLGISPNSSQEEAKKQYKKLSKTWHPDINKDPGAEATFKKINQAYQVIQNGETVDDKANISSAWDFINNPFNVPHTNVGRATFPSHVQVDISISFKDAAQGCKVDLKYGRQAKCPDCEGRGQKSVGNGCQICGGRGQVVQKVEQRSGTSINISTCPGCQGRVNTKSCVPCSATGVVDSEMSINVSIPAAVIDGTKLRLQNGGNYTGSIMGMVDQFTDAFLHIHVAPISGLRMEGSQVVSETHISLLNSFQGCTRSINTIDGEKQIDIPSGTKNKDEISFMTGDGRNVVHRLIVHVGYPSNVDRLIDLLSGEE